MEEAGLRDHPAILVCEDVVVKYTVVLQRTDEGYSVGCPGLPGCWSQGQTEQEALENIRLAIQEYLAAVRDSPHEGELREVEIGA